MVLPAAPDAVRLRCSAGSCIVEPPAIGPGMVTLTTPPTWATTGVPVPRPEPPVRLADTKVVLAGTGTLRSRPRRLLTEKPPASVGTCIGSGVRTASKAAPAATVAGASAWIEVSSVSCCGAPIGGVPWKSNETGTAAAALASGARANVAAATTPPARDNKPMRRAGRFIGFLSLGYVVTDG